MGRFVPKTQALNRANRRENADGSGVWGGECESAGGGKRKKSANMQSGEGYGKGSNIWRNILRALFGQRPYFTAMILWKFALCLMAVSGLIGYYQGAVRVGFSLVGLLVAALLAMPLSGLMKPILGIFGLTHPVLVSFVAPALAYLLVLIIFKTAAMVAHKKIEAYYKYKCSDTQRSLFERVNQRLGICVGLANATVYVFLLATVAYVFGYFTLQVSGADKDSAGLKMANRVSEELESTGMSKAIAPFVPATVSYYDGADIIGHVYHNPLASQSRLSSYPAFLGLADNSQFKSLGDDVKFQQFWLEGHSFGELLDNAKIQPLIESPDLYSKVMGLLKGDLKDLKEYLETGRSAKYDDEKILGRWTFDYKQSMARARRGKPNMTLAELRRTRAILGLMTDGMLTALIDNRAILKLASTNTIAQTADGTWKDSGAGKYTLSLYASSLPERDRRMELQASIESSKLLVTKDGYAYVFEK